LDCIPPFRKKKGFSVFSEERRGSCFSVQRRRVMKRGQMSFLYQKCKERKADRRKLEGGGEEEI